VYVDLMPDKHLPLLHTLDPAEMSKHPLYKTRRCKLHDDNIFGRGCPRGSACPYAHSEEELRRPSDDLPAETYQFEIRLQLDRGRCVLHTCVFCVSCSISLGRLRVESLHGSLHPPHADMTPLSFQSTLSGHQVLCHQGH
jgi:hypothetical protein